MLLSCVRPSVRLSVTSRCCIETTGRIELAFGMWAFFCVVRKFGTNCTNCISLWNSASNSGFKKKIRHGKWIALSTKLVDGRACWRHLYDSRRVVAYIHVGQLQPSNFITLISLISCRFAPLHVAMHYLIRFSGQKTMFCLFSLILYISLLLGYFSRCMFSVAAILWCCNSFCIYI